MDTLMVLFTGQCRAESYFYGFLLRHSGEYVRMPHIGAWQRAKAPNLARTDSHIEILGVPFGQHNPYFGRASQAPEVRTSGVLSQRSFSRAREDRDHVSIGSESVLTRKTSTST